MIIFDIDFISDAENCIREFHRYRFHRAPGVSMNSLGGVTICYDDGYHDVWRRDFPNGRVISFSTYVEGNEDLSESQQVPISNRRPTVTMDIPDGVQNQYFGAGDDIQGTLYFKKHL